jgi:hypothetical protein
MGNEQAIAALRARPSLEPAPLTVADALAVPEVRALVDAVQAIGAMPEGYCFCSNNRIGDDSKSHEPECAELRAALRGIGGAE